MSHRNKNRHPRTNVSLFLNQHYSAKHTVLQRRAPEGHLESRHCRAYVHSHGDEADVHMHLAYLPDTDTALINVLLALTHESMHMTLDRLGLDVSSRAFDTGAPSWLYDSTYLLNTEAELRASAERHEISWDAYDQELVFLIGEPL